MKTKKYFLSVAIVAFLICFVFLLLFPYDTTQYKRIGETNFYLTFQVEGVFLFHSDGTEGTFFPITHEGIIYDVLWNEQFVIIKCKNMKQRKHWYIIRNLKGYNYHDFKIRHCLNEREYQLVLDSIGLKEKKLEHIETSW